MADLKTKSTSAQGREVILTKGAGTAIEDGDGEPFIGAIVNDLTTGGATAPLSAEQGKELNEGKASLIVAKNVVSVTKTNAFSETLPARPTIGNDVTGLIVTITPNHVNSKIEISGHVSIQATSANILVHLFRNGSQIARSDSIGGPRAHTMTSAPTSGPNIEMAPINFMDNPNTTDPVSYSIRFSQVTADTQVVHVNRTVDAPGTARPTLVSTLTAKEIPA